MIKTRYLLPLLLLAVPVGAAEESLPPVPQFTIPRASGPITIDGRLDERAWERAPRVGAFVDENGGATRDPVDAKVLWDDNAIYFAFHVRDTKIRGSLLGKDDPIYTEEVVEIFLSPTPDGRPYLEYEFNPLGTVLDIFLTDDPQKGGLSLWDWDSKRMRHAVHLDGTTYRNDDTDRGWTVEVEIPFHDLRWARGVPPKPGDVWRGTLVYYNRPDDKTLEHFTWSPPFKKSWPHVVDRFGRFVFGK